MILKEDYAYLTKNRKLKLEEYNDDGELIDVIELGFGTLSNVLFDLIDNTYCGGFVFSRKKEKEYFTGKKLVLAKKIGEALHRNFCFTNRNIEFLEKIFEVYSEEEIEFALDFKDYGGYRYDSVGSVTDFMVVLKDINRFRTATFLDVLKWVQETNGIYYAVNDKGEKGMLYFETPPTKKQAQHQYKKNGKKIVFLDFKTWKIHLVNTSELI